MRSPKRELQLTETKQMKIIIIFFINFKTEYLPGAW